MVVVLLAGFVLRQKGWLTGDKSKVVSNSQLSELNSRVGAIDTRLGEAENDIRHLPTREEFHKMEVSLARYDERMKNLAKTTTATNRAVGRIEDFMIDVSKKGGRR
ncbi:hypothetical protein JI58_03920 [Marinosulfonomonas sp. PRT-SC04]|nr:hypothetical protein JI58_03920 [Marinosulfonomonas sp. PRT-SC04]